MEYKKIREDVDKCGPLCPMYFSIFALNEFIKSEKKLKCPRDFCNNVVNALDEDGKLTCSVSGKKTSVINGLFEEDGSFVLYEIKEEEELIDKIDQELGDGELKSNEKIIENINKKLDAVEGYFVKKLKDASYFFTQCREVDEKERVVCFYNSKNKLLNKKKLSKMSDEEREQVMLKGHEIIFSFKRFSTMSANEIKNKLDIFFKTLYDSLTEQEKLSCDGCRWQKNMVQYKSMDCINCTRNENSKVPKKSREDNYC